jgi:hypothetical protein
MILYEAKGKKTNRVISSKAYQYVDLIKMNILEKEEISKAVQSLYLSKACDNHS